MWLAVCVLCNVLGKFVTHTKCILNSSERPHIEMGLCVYGGRGLHSQEAPSQVHWAPTLRKRASLKNYTKIKKFIYDIILKFI